MKRLCYLMLVFVLFTSTQSCEKDNPSKTSTNSIQISLKLNEIYHFDLGYFGDEEGALISKQANHFQTSKIDRDINSGKIIYTYVPTIDYSGMDEVELKSIRGSDGASPDTNIITTVVKFSISK